MLAYYFTVKVKQKILCFKTFFLQLCKMNLGVKETHVGVFCFNNFALAGHKNRSKIEESSEFDFFSYIQISDELDELKVCTFVHIDINS